MVARLARFRVHLVTADPPESPVTVPLARVCAGPLFVTSLRARAALFTMRARLVHTHGLWTGLSAGAVAHARRTGAVLIVSPHGMLDPWALRRSRLRKWLAMTMIERSHLEGAIIHALNAAERDAIRDLGITAPIALIPNGVDPAPGRILPPPSWMDRPTLLFLGRLHAKKGISNLIDAWSRIADKFANWQLAIAGWDDGVNDFREEAARANGRIVFPGPLFGDEKGAAFAHATAFVLPSHSEGLPMTVLEAWAFGLPVFMTRACNLPEGFDFGAAAEIKSEPVAMAKVLSDRLSEKAWLYAAGDAGRRLVAQRFTWDIVTAAFQALYAYALGQGPQPKFVSGPRLPLYINR